jgi:hypothetical protein
LFDPDDFVEDLKRLRCILDNKDGPAHPVGRYFCFSQRRLREFRTQLFSEVAAEATEKFASKVSPRLVETAWEEHKRLANELRADDSSLEHLTREP